MKVSVGLECSGINKHLQPIGCERVFINASHGFNVGIAFDCHRCSL
jgi:hypothetical protein